MDKQLGKGPGEFIAALGHLEIQGNHDVAKVPGQQKKGLGGAAIFRDEMLALEPFEDFLYRPVLPKIVGVLDAGNSIFGIAIRINREWNITLGTMVMLGRKT